MNHATDQLDNERSDHSVTTNSCAIAAAALYLYDTLLTFSDSIELIWQRKISGASMLYIVNRYIMVPYLVLELVALDEKDCESQPALMTLKILTRIFNIIHDALILFLTWYRTRGGLLDLARRTEEGDSVVTRLLLNGAIYFMSVVSTLVLRILLILRCRVHLFLNLADAVLTVTMIFESTSIFNAIFTPLILSHFFLSIRRAQYANEGGYAEESKVSALEFASFEADDDNCARSASRESEEDWGLASEPVVI
ncbi:hypothetical protein EVJ58_g3690 [Rhodofomes roseus]|uniref:DUF6533 domain-containing protein n=1 Tax=Rhodofomes roseus TaxID=34475 RepID=A0A4Y9YLM3_9APHY|nr:hypothetical protein EVJ58_g3690 [Rhodofomes roseus]